MRVLTSAACPSVGNKRDLVFGCVNNTNEICVGDDGNHAGSVLLGGAGGPHTGGAIGPGRSSAPWVGPCAFALFACLSATHQTVGLPGDVLRVGSSRGQRLLCDIQGPSTSPGPGGTPGSAFPSRWSTSVATARGPGQVRANRMTAGRWTRAEVEALSSGGAMLSARDGPRY